MQFIRIRFIKPRGHGLVVHVHLAPDTLSAPCHPVGDPVSVTLMTTQSQTTIHICMMSQLVY